jgi:sugar/nucleoside kinase (ribokinase family)
VEHRARAILCAGTAVVDEIFRVGRFPTPEEKVHATAFLTLGGGCAANAAVTITRLGGRARLAAPLGGPAGTDSIGDRILDGLARERVDCGGVERLPGIGSPISGICIDDAGERTIITYRDDRITEARVGDPAPLVASVDAVLADNRYPDFVLPICREAHRRGIPVVIDGDKAARDKDTLLANASHIIFSAEALRETVGMHDVAAALKLLAARMNVFLAVTEGANGVLWIEAGAVRRMPAFRVQAIDTLAAGDVFHGAFVLALAEGDSHLTALRFAAATAALKCTRFGGIGGAPTRPEVEAFLQERG